MSARAPKPLIVAIGFGANIQPAANLPRALALLRAQVPVVALSGVWETPPVGTAGPNFYNAAVLVHSPVSHTRLKEALLRPIEAQLGRIRTADPNAPRPIDLDVLVAGRRVVDENIWRYAHLAVPLAEILPNLPHPHSGETLAAIARRLAAHTPLRRVALPAWA